MLLALFLACLAGQAAAGGYGRGKPHRLGLYTEEEYYFNHSPAPQANSVPEEFNWCAHDGVNSCTSSWNQHIPQYCGSCWAHGSLSMIQDRLKVKKLRAGDLSPDVMLGRQTLLNCAGFKGYGDGCDGGEPLEVFKYMTEYGLPDESCLHYAATDHNVFKKKGYKDCPTKGKCMNCMPSGKGDDYKCWGIDNPVMYKLTAYGKLEPGEEAMKQEILARGPIVCGIACPDTFVYHYHSSKHNGVYIDKTGDTELDHDVEVVGWGEEDGLKYWLVRNSWGTYWGELGFFKLQRGVNALQIESGDCWYADPEYGIESEVVNGDFEGSMFGLKDGKKHHHHDDPEDEDADDEDDDVQPEVQGEEVQGEEVQAAVPEEVVAQVAELVGEMMGDVQAQLLEDEQVRTVQEIGEVAVALGAADAAATTATWVVMVPGAAGVRHACEGMRRAAGQAMGQLWGMVAGAGSSWPLQQGMVGEQQQQQGMRAGRAGGMMAKRMFAGARVAEQ